MSWQTYIDDHLLGHMGNGRYLTSAAIIGQDGNVWAQSDTFPALKPQEISKIVHGFVDPGEIAQHGLYIGGAKYMVIQGEPGAVIRGKKGSAGVTIKKTNSALVFGIYDDPVTAGECNVNVEGLGDYLINAGI